MSSRRTDRRKKRRSRSRSPISDQKDRAKRYLERDGGEDRRPGSRREDDRRKETRRNTKSHERNRQEYEKQRETKHRNHNLNLNDSEEQAGTNKEQPNFKLSGKLTEYTNTYKGVVIKYNEPPEALKPKTRWRLYPFKGDQSMPVMYIHRQSAYLIGRERHIVDMAVDHPSCSKQHAVLQYRLVNYEREDGTAGRRCKPYIIDLESANGTFLNNQKIEARRYYELKEKDVLKFGYSTREYVLLNDKSKVSQSDDDVESDKEET
ncbi:smad nuclear-interacting protein 1-like [Xenia sp. Carnegie-2017]|uniref:smad nuclear-interacting protein 1-like n=1 Tax=Xenia sp. Carnegie-2017 TaxID=2897299 RepID=UPI001F04EE53|nr:smad nuclear-interacting protein 1-like [Xenia sp. Carnegie-2017]XP_046839596.1 smad nuclear-interacting protein 1-like [Xenia sp. Carnegie-2017]